MLFFSNTNERYSCIQDLAEGVQGALHAWIESGKEVLEERDYWTPAEMVTLECTCKRLSMARRGRTHLHTPGSADAVEIAHGG